MQEKPALPKELRHMGFVTFLQQIF